ncbi:MAG: RraA family protein [Gemmataceae bacterium]
MSSTRPRSADLHPGPGFRIRVEYPQIDRSLIERFLQFDVPDISDSLNRLYAVDTSVRCLNATPQTLCGSVCTVRVFPGDNLMVHKALDIAKPGDVVIVDAHGDRSMNAVLGDLICAKAQHRGIAGFIVDGLIRDLPAIEELNYPVFARGTTAVGPLHRGPGEINYPINCGGVVVNPGDVVVADSAGIVIIPLAHAGEILARLDAHRERLSSYLEAVRRGEFSNAWVDDLLGQNGCPISERQPS